MSSDLSLKSLVHAAEQLDAPELQEFTAQILSIQAKRNAPSISEGEAQLLLRINERLPLEVQNRYDELIAKRDAETLTPQELSELERLTAVAEGFDVARVESLTKLASLRGISLAELVDQLQLEATDV